MPICCHWLPRGCHYANLQSHLWWQSLYLDDLVFSSVIYFSLWYQDWHIHDKDIMLVLFWTNKRHPIARPYWQAMGCLCEVWGKITMRYRECIVLKALWRKYWQGLLLPYNPFMMNSLWPSDTLWWQIWVIIGSGNGLVLSSVKSSDIHIRALSLEMPQPSVTEIRFKITHLKFN